MQNTWFIADTHFGHKNILKFHDRVVREVDGKRVRVTDESIEVHDDCLIELWNETIAKSDTVYIIGDFSFHNQENTIKLLTKLNGYKHLIVGNHDKSSHNLAKHFTSVSHIKDVVFRKDTYEFLQEDFHVVMCHYPMLTWQSRSYGSVNVHGHCHGEIDNINDESGELRVDVGIDGKLSNYKFVSLQQLYEHFKNITNGKSLHAYVKDKLKESKIPTNV